HLFYKFVEAEASTGGVDGPTCHPVIDAGQCRAFRSGKNRYRLLVERTMRRKTREAAFEENDMVDTARGFLRMRAIRPPIPVAATQIWTGSKKKKFPAPVKLSSKVTAWRAADVDRWEIEKGSASGDAS